MCSAFTPDCGYDNSTIIFIGDVQCPNTKCSGKHCLHKKTFQSLGRSDDQNPQCACVPGAQYSFWRSNKFPFLVVWPSGLLFWREPRSIQDLIRDVYCPGKYCFNREDCESLDGYVTTPRSIYGCGKCGAWLFVHKDLFMLQEDVKTTKTDKTRFFC